MALKLNLESNTVSEFIQSVLLLNGVTDIYIRIDRYTGEGDKCRFLIGCYNQIELIYKDDNGEDYTYVDMRKLNIPESVYQFTVIEDGGSKDFNVRKQGYEYLKTLPEFVSCEDC